MRKKNGRVMAPDELLAESAKLFKKRNADYGSDYKHFGAVLMTLFPRGVFLRHELDMTRFALLIHLVGKLSRYARNFSNRGHPDSLRDLRVYAAMLEEIDAHLR